MRRGGESLPLASATSRYANAKENFVICSALSCLPPPLRLGAPPLKPQKWAWKRQGELSPWLQRHCYRGETALQLRIRVRSVPVVMKLWNQGYEIVEPGGRFSWSMRVKTLQFSKFTWKYFFSYKNIVFLFLSYTVMQFSYLIH